MIENQTAKDVVYLASCAVNKRVPDKSRIEKMNLSEVLALAKRHLIAATVSVALESAGYKSPETTSAVALALRRTILYDLALKSVGKELTERGIWRMPLKGAVVKEYYPKYGMREFGDYDVLIDPSRAADVKEVMENLGFTTIHFNRSNHDVYRKEPSLTFEMHTALFSVLHGKEICDYYQNVEERLIGDGCDRRFTPEDFYLYLVAHEYKHYLTVGSGLRFLLDVYVFLKNVELDADYLRTEAQKLGVEDFEKENRDLAFRLFDGEKLTNADDKNIEYRLESGAIGTKLHLVENKIRQNGQGKFQYMLNRFFVPFNKKKPSYAAYAKAYPLFYKYRILLPFLPFYRVFKSIWSGRFRPEAKALRNARTDRAPR